VSPIQMHCPTVMHIRSMETLEYAADECIHRMPRTRVTHAQLVLKPRPQAEHRADRAELHDVAQVAFQRQQQTKRYATHRSDCGQCVAPHRSALTRYVAAQ